MSETGRDPIVTDETHSELLKDAQLLIMALTQREYMGAKSLADDIKNALYTVERKTLGRMREDQRAKIQNMIDDLSESIV